MAYKILGRDKTLNNLSYPQWLVEWCKWLHSAAPTYNKLRNEVLFTRGNVSYSTVPDTGQPRTRNDPFYNRASSAEDGIFRGEVIYSDTPIYVDVISAFYFVGERYDGEILETPQDCRQACWRDMEEGGAFWFSIQRKGEIEESIVSELIQSPTFNIEISDQNPLLGAFEIPPSPGNREGVSVGRISILERLEKGEYRLRFGGIGRAQRRSSFVYQTDSVYDLIVQDVAKVDKTLLMANVDTNIFLNEFDKTRKYEAFKRPELKGLVDFGPTPSITKEKGSNKS